MSGKPPTLPEVRDLLAETCYQISNRGGDTQDGRLFKRIYLMLDWLVREYIAPEEEP